MRTAMRVLIDTNIFIYREDDHVISNDMQTLLGKLRKIGADILIHPLSLEDLKKDLDKDRREIMLSKIRTYSFLDKPPNPETDPEFSNSIKSDAEDTEVIDNAILYAVYKDAVDFLVTEDRGIHKKARRLEIDERVLLINDALPILDQYISKEGVLIAPLALREEHVYDLNSRDPIFNSLRSEYEEFDKWLTKIKRQGRKCLVHYREDGNIGALLIYKIEDALIDSNPPLPKKKRLKISTFKVTHVGYKLGELLIKLSTDISIKNDISEIYLTHFSKSQDRLIELISEFGFYKVAENHRGEDIFAKKLIADVDETTTLSPLEIAKRFYPSFYDGVLSRKFIIPIRPEYHNRLFTTFQERQITLAEYAGDFIVEGNTIGKAYICHSRIKKMQAGDIILFYLSEEKRMTSIGIVEAMYRGMQNSNEIIRRVGKRTVYSKNEIEEIAKKTSTVIMFKHHFHLKNPLSLRQLQAMGVLSGPPQSIMQIADESYVKIKSKGGIDERFTIH